MYMYNEDLVLNNLQRLICHKTQPTDRPTDRPSNQHLEKESNLHLSESTKRVGKVCETVILLQPVESETE